MKAFAIPARDAAPTFHDAAAPAAGAGEVLIDVEMASVNAFDLGIIAGYFWDMLPHQFPVVVGRDFVGTVASVGDGVEGLAVGDRVTGEVPAMAGLSAGTFAPAVATPASATARVPDGVTTAQAGAIGLAGIAALDAVGALAVEAGDVLLVSGATGGVGHLVVQLAANRGATVIATGRPAAADFLRGLGAHHVVDHTADLSAQVAQLAPGGVDKVLHAAGDAAALAGLVRPDGMLGSLLGVEAAQAERGDVECVLIVHDPTTEKFDELLELVAAGRLRPHVAEVVPLDDAPRALELFQAGTTGKVLVAVR